MTDSHPKLDPIYAEAVERFESWLTDAQAIDVNEPDAMVLATCNSDGLPSARVVLLRGFDARGFVFYTNSKSRKGDQLADNPRAALCLYWDAIGKQVRAEGHVTKATDEESNAYWSNRARRSQIASTVSLQSQRLPDRNTYEQKVAAMEQELDGKPVPRPQHWHGFRVVPNRIEFWTNVKNRMHERAIYATEARTEAGASQRTDVRAQSWEKFLLYP